MPVEMQTVRVNIREQLVAFYDDGVSMEGSVRVEGCVQVEPLIGSTIINTSFDLVVRDLLEQVEQVDIVDVSCQDASHSISQHGLHHTDRVFHVMGQSLSSRQRDDTGSIALLNYTCTPALRPVPLVRHHFIEYRLPPIPFSHSLTSDNRIARRFAMDTR